MIGELPPIGTVVRINPTTDFLAMEHEFSFRAQGSVLKLFLGNLKLIELEVWEWVATLAQSLPREVPVGSADKLFICSAVFSHSAATAKVAVRAFRLRAIHGPSFLGTRNCCGIVLSSDCNELLRIDPLGRGHSARNYF